MAEQCLKRMASVPVTLYDRHDSVPCNRPNGPIKLDANVITLHCHCNASSFNPLRSALGDTLEFIPTLIQDFFYNSLASWYLKNVSPTN